MTSIVTSPDKKKSKIATIKTVNEELWIKTEGTVKILITSWAPLRALIMRQKEALASI
jgi:hypothetical protein